MSQSSVSDFTSLYKIFTIIENKSDYAALENISSQLFLNRPLALLQKTEKSKPAQLPIAVPRQSPTVVAEKMAENLARMYEELLFLHRSGWVSKSTGLWINEFKNQLSKTSQRTLALLPLDFTKTQAAKILSDIESELGRQAQSASRCLEKFRCTCH